MKTKILFIVSLFLAVAVTLATPGLLDTFSAHSDGSVIKVKWRSAQENDISRYELERSISGRNFVKVHDEDAKGYSASYQYIDNEAYLKEKFKASTDQIMSDKIYSYRLKIIRKDNSYTYSDKAIVTHNISSIRRTWGMIKEMFR